MRVLVVAPVSVLGLLAASSLASVKKPNRYAMTEVPS